MTRERLGVKGTGKVFASPDEVQAAYDTGDIHLQAWYSRSRFLCWTLNDT